jgi:hypothetical protein
MNTAQKAFWNGDFCDICHKTVERTLWFKGETEDEIIKKCDYCLEEDENKPYVEPSEECKKTRGSRHRGRYCECYQLERDKKMKKFILDQNENISDYSRRLKVIEDYLEEQSQYCSNYYCKDHNLQDPCYGDEFKEDQRCSHILTESSDIKNWYKCRNKGCDYGIQLS